MSQMQVNMIQDKKKLKFTAPVRYAICIILCLLSLFPFYMMIINGTMTNGDVLVAKYYLPKGRWIENLKGLQIWCENAQIISIWKAMLNSLIVTVPATALQVYFAALTAYAVTVYNFKYRDLAWGFIYGIMMIPMQVSIIGFIKVCNLTHTYGTFLPLIIPAMAAPTTVYFMKQYMEAGFSLEIVDAARIDGSSEFKTFNTIAIPLLKPAMATQAIFGFVGTWNNLYTPSLILATKKKELGTLPLYIESIKSNDKQRDWGQIYVALTIAVMPILIAYLVLSKYIVAGVALGGVKE